MAVQDVDANVDLVAPWYEPSTERIDASQIEQFRRWLQDQGHSAPNQRALHQWSIDAPEQFWSCLWRYFDLPSTSTPALSDAPVPVRPGIRWFPDVQVNYTGELFARQHQMADETALIGVAEDGGVSTLSWAELRLQVARLASWLRSQQVGPGDRVVAYLPDIPEATVAFLATAAVGAVWSACGQDYAPTAALARLGQLDPKVLIASSGYDYAGRYRARMAESDEIRQGLPDLQTAILIGASDANWTTWSDVIGAASDMGEPALTTEPVAFDHPLWVLFSSGTTGKPKGIMHTTGGYLTHVTYTFKYVFDIHPDTDVYWCSADVGWVTGHSYIVYGPLANGATQVMYEGVPNFPANDRFWEIIERYKVTIFYTAPTAIRTFMKWGIEEPAKHDLSSLRLIGSVGEPINPEAWMWYREHIGRNECPIIDTWWQTETGGAMISPLPGVVSTKPGSATFPIPGVAAEIVDESGKRVDRGGGYLTLTKPWPGMLRGVWGDQKRYRETYWSRFPGRYFAGDGAKLDDDGYLWLLGRVDDVMNVSGHRISTTEVESALVSHPAVAEAAVVGANDATTGQAIIAYVTLVGGSSADAQDLRNHVAKEIGAIAKPKTIYFTPDLPKTRSGKIMRRLLRDVAEGRNLGDTTTLADASVVSELQKRAAEAPSED